MDSSTMLGYLENSMKRRSDHTVSEWSLDIRNRLIADI
jgi:hypothetical protein